MGQTIRNILFEGCIGRHLELHAVASIVILYDFYDAVFLIFCVPVIIDSGVKECRHFQFAFCLKQFVILNGLRNTAGGKNPMEFVPMAQRGPVI